MSIPHSNRTTPRTSASHGRIVTQNSALSITLQDDHSHTADDLSHHSHHNHTAEEIVALPQPRSLSVSSPSALDVVSPNHNNSEVPTTTTASVLVNEPPNALEDSYLGVDNPSEVEKTVVKDNIDTNTEEDGEINEDSLHEPSADIAQNSNTGLKKPSVDTNSGVREQEISDTPRSNVYDYHSLKSRQKDSEAIRIYSNQPASGDSDNLVSDKPSEIIIVGDRDNNVRESNSYEESRLKSRKQDSRRSVQSHALEDFTEPQHLHVKSKPREHSLLTKHYTGLSLHSRANNPGTQYPISVESDTSLQSIPPLDLQGLAPESDSDLDIDSPPVTHHSDLLHSGQNLHASGPTVAVSHLSPTGNFASGRKTYEVPKPSVFNSLPHVNSSNNFRQNSARDPSEASYRSQHQGPDYIEGNRSDLADDLNVPFDFDSQAQVDQTNNNNRPPSPPVQTTPPPYKEPATSLHSNSQSQIYAVTNPEIQRAQGERQNTRTSVKQSEVRFSAGSQRTGPVSDRNNNSRLRERPSTPYAKSPQREELPPTPPDWDIPHESREVSATSKASLPPQHPPLDTLHTPKPGSREKGDNQSIKRVYVESPSFTKEEEEEYRFVSSRLDDIEDKNLTLREMDTGNQRGYGGDDYQRQSYGDARSQKTNSDYRRQEIDQNRYEDRMDDRYTEKSKRRSQAGDDRTEERHSIKSKRRSDEGQERFEDRYEDRSQEANGYSNYRDREKDRNYGDREQDRNYGDRDRDRDEEYRSRDRAPKYDTGSQYRANDGYDRYDRLRDEREEYDREPRREDETNLRYGGKQNTDLDERDLRHEREYQQELKQRIDKSKITEVETPGYMRGRQRDDYDKENDFPRDSLEYPDERDQRRDQMPRDSLEYSGGYAQQEPYVQQQQNWENPPPNPYGNENEGYNPYQMALVKQDSKPDFYDAEDVAKMELVNPKPPKYDYIENNKFDYGKNPRKSYREIVHKKKEEEEKLETVFITPKLPSKKKKGHHHPQKAQSAQPQHMGYQPPEQFPVGFKPSSAEELWANRAAVLSRKKDSAQAGKGSAAKQTGGPKKWNTNNSVKQPYKYEPPPPMPNQGQIYRSPGYHPGSGSNQSGYSQPNTGYGTPTRALQPLENRPAPPNATELMPTAVKPESPFRRHMELKPISQEIVTEDGQRISVDINLRLISPPPGHSGATSPRHQQQQLALVPVPDAQYPADHRGIGVPYQMQDPYEQTYGYTDVSYTVC